MAGAIINLFIAAFPETGEVPGTRLPVDPDWERGTTSKHSQLQGSSTEDSVAPRPEA